MSKRKRILVRILIYFVGLVMPILGILNCKGFSSASMSAKNCFIDNELFISYSSFYYGFLVISSFMFLIPVFIYIGVIVLLAKIVPQSKG